jgi:hypothetical protein
VACPLQQWPVAATSPGSLAAVRTGVGAVMLLTPQVLPQVLGVDAGARQRTSWVVQMLGAREVALGAGVLNAERSGEVRAWAVAGSACDVVDALVVAAAVRRGAVGRSLGTAVALSALAADASGLAAAGRR